MSRRIIEKMLEVLSWAMAILLVASVSVVIGYLLMQGGSRLGTTLIFGEAHPIQAILGHTRVFDGIFPAMVGTLFLVLSSVFLAVPVGVGAGIYLAEYATRASRRLFGFFFDILAGIPSIVIGLFGFSITVFLHKIYSDKIGPCLAVSAVSLAFLVLPYIIRGTQRALEDLPASIRWTAPALGASRIQNIVYVLIPHALSGIGSGVILAIGRCAEDTAVILLTGVVASAGIPQSIFSPFEALPFYIYYISSQYANHEELIRGYGACLILLSICGVLLLVAFYLQKSLHHRALYRK
jgi:phosphate transport system permease protein